jgi:hypothetical protein
MGRHDIAPTRYLYPGLRSSGRLHGDVEQWQRLDRHEITYILVYLNWTKDDVIWPVDRTPPAWYRMGVSMMEPLT